MANKPQDAAAAMIRNLEEKTGKSLGTWVALVKRLGPLKHGAIVKHLKDQHGMTHGYANLVAHSAAGVSSEGAPHGDDLVDAQYAGDKAALRPIYDRLVREIARLGKDVEIAPKKAYVSVRRSKQFAILQPSTKSRFDVGLNLKGVPAKGKLEASGSWNAMVTHRVRLESAKEVDAELVGWLKKAYESA